MSALGQKQTFAVHDLMSALPPKATSNATQGMSAKGQKRVSIHFVGECEDRRWYTDAKRFCCL